MLNTGLALPQTLSPACSLGLFSVFPRERQRESVLEFFWEIGAQDAVFARPAAVKVFPRSVNSNKGHGTSSQRILGHCRECFAASWLPGRMNKRDQPLCCHKQKSHLSCCTTSEVGKPDLPDKP